MALISILDNCTMPVSGVEESCIISTEPLLTWVVSADHKADDASPKRTSLPSMTESNVEVDERLSDQMAENKEMLAVKAAGIPFMRLMAPMAITAVFISIGAYFIGDKLVPVAYNKIFTLRDDIGRTKNEIKIPSCSAMPSSRPTTHYYI